MMLRMAMHAASLLATLQALAPLELAEPWDNVGVLLAPPARDIRRLLLTIDLTEEVVEEAIEFQADAVVAYHPPIFSGLKRILSTEPQGRVVARLLSHQILTYSPHTALDAVPGGINDWLADAFPNSTKCAIDPCQVASVKALYPDTAVGQGRLVALTEPLHIEDVVILLKQYLRLSHLRLSRAAIHQHSPIASVALCAGSGGSIVTRCEADLYLTGEMRHHDVLASKAKGTSVILTEHTNTERGYLPLLEEQIRRRCPDLYVHVSTLDCDPLRVV